MTSGNCYEGLSSEPRASLALSAKKMRPPNKISGRKMKISSPFEEELFWVAQRN